MSRDLPGQNRRRLAERWSLAARIGATRILEFVKLTTTHILLSAELMSRVFGINVLTCPECSGQCRVIACIEDPDAVRKILSHLGLPTQGVHLKPARRPPDRQLDFVDVV